MPELNEITKKFDPEDIGVSDLLLIYSQAEAASGTVTLAKFLSALEVVVADADATLDDLTVTSIAATSGAVGELEVTTVQVSPDGSQVDGVFLGEDTFTPANITAGSSETVTGTLTGATTAMYLTAALTGALPDGLTMQAWISGDDEVSIKFHNTTSGTINSASYTARMIATSVVT